jgi:hypothetical protein
MVMNSRSNASMGPLLLSLMLGAAAGALLVLLNTNKPALERERRAKALARWTKRGSEAVAEDSEGFMEDWRAQSPGSQVVPKGP